MIWVDFLVPFHSDHRGSPFVHVGNSQTNGLRPAKKSNFGGVVAKEPPKEWVRGHRVVTRAVPRAFWYDGMGGLHLPCLGRHSRTYDLELVELVATAATFSRTNP